jgi:uncharacterized protein YjbI with pentapeptide repeats
VHLTRQHRRVSFTETTLHVANLDSSDFYGSKIVKLNVQFANPRQRHRLNLRRRTSAG